MALITSDCDAMRSPTALAAILAHPTSPGVAAAGRRAGSARRQGPRARGFRTPPLCWLCLTWAALLQVGLGCTARHRPVGWATWAGGRSSMLTSSGRKTDLPCMSRGMLFFSRLVCWGLIVYIAGVSGSPPPFSMASSATSTGRPPLCSNRRCQTASQLSSSSSPSVSRDITANVCTAE